MFERPQVQTIVERMREQGNPLMQFIVGPRQTGKSTMFSQALEHVDLERHVVSADDVIDPNEDWLRTEWQQARNMSGSSKRPVLLVIDEVQKVRHWSVAVKGLYDRDRREQVPVKAILTGSSSLLLQKGLEESLMGRFEIIRSPHWGFAECKAAFGFSLDDYLFYGGYPGAAIFAGNPIRWATYVRDAIIEPTISRDVLSLEDVRKPALMRAVFRLAAAYSGQELSYNKMLGQLQDAGNTVTIAGYLELLSKAGMACALPKFSDKELTKRRSTPRLMVFDTSLMTSLSDKGKEALLGDPALRGHLVESSVGARLLARAQQEGFEVSWWREKNEEVDFVLRRGASLSAIEVKSGHESSQSGMATFLAQNPGAKRIVVGGSASGACSLEDFLLDRAPLFFD